MTDRYAFSQSSIESIAGFTAGTVSTLVVHPLDIIKTRLQSKLRHQMIPPVLPMSKLISPQSIQTRALLLKLVPVRRSTLSPPSASFTPSSQPKAPPPSAPSTAA